MGIFLAYIRRRPSSRLRFCVFWKAGRDRVFLISEPGFDINRTWFLPITWTSYNYTAVYIYYPLWYSVHLELTVLFWKSISLIFWSPWSHLSYRVILVPSWFLFSLSILFFWSCLLGIVHFMLKMVAEIRARSGIVVSQRGDVEDCCVLSWLWILLSFPALFKFRGRNFY